MKYTLRFSLAVLLGLGLSYSIISVKEQGFETREEFVSEFLEAWGNLWDYGFRADTYQEIADESVKKDILKLTAEFTSGATRPLIQTIHERDEVLGLIHLGLLETETGWEENLDKAKENVTPSVTEIIMEEYYGSGVILAIEEDEILIISNQHLLKYGSDTKVIFYDGTEAKGHVIGVSDEYDVGFLRVSTENLPLALLGNIRSISVDDTCYYSLEQGDEIVLVGSTDGVAKSVYEGTIGSMWYYIEDFDEYMIYNYCYAKPGMSGGGTYDAHGHYIGMITGGNGSESASLPLPIILEEYRKITGRVLEFSVQ